MPVKITILLMLEEGSRAPLPRVVGLVQQFVLGSDFRHVAPLWPGWRFAAQMVLLELESLPLSELVLGLAQTQ